jgi:hypothetical protein
MGGRSIVSPCFDCKEHRKIQLMKEIAIEKNLNKEQLILLFGRGNGFDLIKRLSDRNELSRYLTVGIIQEFSELSEEEYYQIFELDVDPRIFIFKENEIIFSEKLTDRNKINLDFFSKKF